jgi:hypothetical protein
MKKAGTSEEVTSPRKADYSTHTAAQEQRTLAALMAGSANTIELRHLHNVMQPAARVKSLREQGHTIRTIRETAPDLEGRPHRGVARYVLLQLAEVAE